MQKLVPLLILDIDDTVRAGPTEGDGKYCNGPEDVKILPGVVEKMREWRANGGRIIGISNQGGIGMGILTAENAHAAMTKTHELCFFMFDKMAMCPHHPDAKDSAFQDCYCRKPKPGGVIETAKDLGDQFNERYPPKMGLFVGDQDTDRQCAESIGFPFQWAKDWRGA